MSCEATGAQRHYGAVLAHHAEPMACDLPLQENGWREQLACVASKLLRSDNLHGRLAWLGQSGPQPEKRLRHEPNK